MEKAQPRGACRLLRRWRAPLALFVASPVVAQDYGDPGGKALTIAGEVRIVASDGEGSWLDGGFGKTRFADGTRDARRRGGLDPRQERTVLQLALRVRR